MQYLKVHKLSPISVGANLTQTDTPNIAIMKHDNTQSYYAHQHIKGRIQDFKLVGAGV